MEIKTNKIIKAAKAPGAIKTLFLLLISSILCGCTTLSYVGEDVNTNNISTIRTTEDMVFSAYKKTLDDKNIKIGVSKTAIPEILALFVQVENLSYETPYVFKVEDLRVYNSEGSSIPFITTNNYLNIWQTQETASMSSVGQFGNTLATMTGLSTNYNDYNQAIVQKNSQENSSSTFQKIEDTGNRILKHTIRVSSTINPRKSQYFYFFLQDPQISPLKVTYKNLEYQFKL